MYLMQVLGFGFFVGARAKCVGKSAGIVFTWRYICRRNAGLAVANREGLVSVFYFIFFYVYNIQFDL